MNALKNNRGDNFALNWLSIATELAIFQKLQPTGILKLEMINYKIILCRPFKKWISF